MALADYYSRGAQAAAQVLGSSFDESRFKELLEETPVGLAIDRKAVESEEGRAIADLTVRLLARLYPTIAFLPGEGAEDEAARLRQLARAINPNITIEDSAGLGISIGAAVSPFSDTIYAGSKGWDALVSTAKPQTLGSLGVPYGPGAAACFACANLFRRIFVPNWPETADSKLAFSTFELRRGATKLPTGVARVKEPVVLIGAGAIGNGALWALARSSLIGTLHVVDREEVELSNLQRYVLGERTDDGAVKVEVARRAFEDSSLDLIPHHSSFAEFVSEEGYESPSLLLALDNASDRRAGQASLPRWIANSWTQPGDLGVSVHPSFTDVGACVACLYLQESQQKNEDQLIAEALLVPELVPQVRQLLHTGEGLNPQFLDLVAQRLGRPPTLLGAFVGRHIRDLYVEGICGGAVLPLGQAGIPNATIHVPLAHQSALAGVLLAAAYERSLTNSALIETRVLRIDLLRPLGEVEAMPAQKRGDGRCICEDDDFRAAYERKWPSARRKPATRPRRDTARPAG